MSNVAKEPSVRSRLSRLLAVLPSLSFSFGLHCIVLLVLGLIVLQFTPQPRAIIPIEAFGNDGADDAVRTFDPLQFVDGPADNRADAKDKTEKTLDQLARLTSAPAIDFNASGVGAVNKLELNTNSASHVVGEMGGRSGAARSTLLTQGGGNKASERAVSLGLRWLARHQLSEGQWNFRHGPDDPGSLETCTTGATGMAILAFLGAGHTHRAGQARFRANVEHGIQFLVSQSKAKEDGDLRGRVVSNEGMYAQGIATLALCEAYGLTRDPKLKGPAQRAINFIVAAQDPKGGGWRYSPHEAGDTTVTGWQVMALKSAKACGLKVPAHTMTGATHFLDSVQTRDGSRYGYDSRGDTPPMTAIGLLCRMYLGAKRTSGSLRNGVQYLSHTGPSLGDIYYDYYATQVLRQWGGAEWTKWNDVLRDSLIDSQVKQGEAAGSWRPTGDRGASAGGRLYQTCLSVMTLEVYYRYLPLYQNESAAR